MVGHSLAAAQVQVDRNDSNKYSDRILILTRESSQLETYFSPVNLQLRNFPELLFTVRPVQYKFCRPVQKQEVLSLSMQNCFPFLELCKSSYCNVCLNCKNNLQT